MRTSFGICNRKVRFATCEDAARAAASASITLRPYRCALCRDYHLTSRTKGMFVGRRSNAASTENPVLQPRRRAMDNAPAEAGSSGE